MIKTEKEHRMRIVMQWIIAKDHCKVKTAQERFFEFFGVSSLEDINDKLLKQIAGICENNLKSSSMLVREITLNGHTI